MPKTKVAITLDKELLIRLDRLVEAAVFANRSQAIQQVLENGLGPLEENRLSRECAKLDPAFEQALAEEGLSEDLSTWPEY